MVAYRRRVRYSSHTNSATMRRIICAAALSLLLPFSLKAQPLPAPTLRQQTRAGIDTTITPSHIVSINPFLLLFGYFSGEYEQRVSPTLSVAVAGSYVNFDSDRYTNIDVKARLYPNEVALRGFGFAASVGASAIRAHTSDCYLYDPALGGSGPCTNRKKTLSSPSVALELQYQWLLGSRRRTAITLGGGLKRYLGSHGDFSVAGVSLFLPTFRSTIGYAF